MMEASTDDRLVLNYKDGNLRESDLEILEGPYWINDSIIDFYFSYLSSSYSSEEILLVNPTMSFWIMHVSDIKDLEEFIRPLKFSSRKLVIFPVNDNDNVEEEDGGLHWSLLVYERESNVFVHHDSKKDFNEHHARQLYEVVFKYMEKAEQTEARQYARYIECDITPRQVNNYDCGVYVMAIARFICQWFVRNGSREASLFRVCVRKKITPSFISGMRKEILEMIEDMVEQNQRSDDNESSRNGIVELASNGIDTLRNVASVINEVSNAALEVLTS